MSNGCQEGQKKIVDFFWFFFGFFLVFFCFRHSLLVFVWFGFLFVLYDSKEGSFCFFISFLCSITPFFEGFSDFYFLDIFRMSDCRHTKTLTTHVNIYRHKKTTCRHMTTHDDTHRHTTTQFFSLTDTHRHNLLTHDDTHRHTTTQFFLNLPTHKQPADT